MEETTCEGCNNIFSDDEGRSLCPTCRANEEELIEELKIKLAGVSIETFCGYNQSEQSEYLKELGYRTFRDRSKVIEAVRKFANQKPQENSILVRGLPELKQLIAGSTSIATVDKKRHPHSVKVKNYVFPTLPFDVSSLRKDEGGMWRPAYKEKIQMSPNEAHIQYIGKDLFDELLWTRKEFSKLKAILEVTFCSWRHDLDAVVMETGEIKMIAEWKKGKRLPKWIERVMYDYLKDLQTLAGIEHPIGLASCYHTFQFFVLPETAEYLDHLNFGNQTLPDFLSQTREQMMCQLAETEISVEEGNESDEDDLEEAGDFEEERIIYATKEYSYEDFHIILPIFLTSFAVCLQSPVRAVDFKPGTPLVVMTEHGWYRKNITVREGKNLTFKWRMPRVGAKKFIFIKSLGHGRDGIVFKACIFSGCLAAIKFFRPPKDEDREEWVNRIDTELTNWQKQCPNDPVKLTCLRGETALIMPYVPALKSQEALRNLSPDHHEKLEEAITHFGHQGLKHNDLISSDGTPKYYHIGFQESTHSSGKVVVHRALLLDLSDVKQVDDKEKAIQEMMNELKLTEHTPQNSPSTIRNIVGSPL